MAVGRSADGLCKLVTLRGSCRPARERRSALLNMQEFKKRRSALFWRLLRATLWLIIVSWRDYNDCDILDSWGVNKAEAQRWQTFLLQGSSPAKLTVWQVLTFFWWNPAKQVILFSSFMQSVFELPPQKRKSIKIDSARKVEFISRNSCLWVNFLIWVSWKF